MTVPDRSTFESIYAGQPPWDIGRPQKAFIGTDRKNRANFDRERGTTWAPPRRVWGAARAGAQLGTRVKARSYAGPGVVATRRLAQSCWRGGRGWRAGRERIGPPPKGPPGWPTVLPGWPARSDIAPNAELPAAWDQSLVTCIRQRTDWPHEQTTARGWAGLR